jgi:hypothetical protein
MTSVGNGRRGSMSAMSQMSAVTVPTLLGYGDRTHDDVVQSPGVADTVASFLDRR